MLLHLNTKRSSECNLTRVLLGVEEVRPRALKYNNYSCSLPNFSIVLSSLNILSSKLKRLLCFPQICLLYKRPSSIQYLFNKNSSSEHTHIKN